MPAFSVSKSELIHSRLYEFAKWALVKIFAHPYAVVCDVYCRDSLDPVKWDSVQIDRYVGIEGNTSTPKPWKPQMKKHSPEFFALDPCMETFRTVLQKRAGRVDLVCCLKNLQTCFEKEESARNLLNNISHLLKPGGYFFGITHDSSTIWAKYQKNVEAYHSKSNSHKPNIMPNCIKSENYTINFEGEEEFPKFGNKYRLKFSQQANAETHFLVHFPSLISMARDAGMEYVEIQNLTEFYEDNRAQFSGFLANSNPSLIDPRGKLTPRSHDLLGLHAAFIFQKPKPDATPPLSTPLLQYDIYNFNQMQWQSRGWREDAGAHAEHVTGLGMISQQKGILGPGPAELRFPEAR